MLLAYILTHYFKQSPMKSILFLFSAILFSAAGVHAQSAHFGIKAGTDIRKIDGKSFKDEFAFGYQAGVFGEVYFNSKYGIQPELYYSETNTKTATDAGSIYSLSNITKAKLGYINIPVLLSIRPIPEISFLIGPQFGILVNKDKSIMQNGKDAIKKGDVAATAGLQINLKKFKVYGRYVLGLNDVNNLETDTWHNQAFHLGLGYRLF